MTAFRPQVSLPGENEKKISRGETEYPLQEGNLSPTNSPAEVGGALDTSAQWGSNVVLRLLLVRYSLQLSFFGNLAKQVFLLPVGTPATAVAGGKPTSLPYWALWAR